MFHRFKGSVQQIPDKCRVTDSQRHLQKHLIINITTMSLVCLSVCQTDTILDIQTLLSVSPPPLFLSLGSSLLSHSQSLSVFFFYLIFQLCLLPRQLVCPGSPRVPVKSERWMREGKWEREVEQEIGGEGERAGNKRDGQILLQVNDGRKKTCTRHWREREIKRDGRMRE